MHRELSLDEGVVFSTHYVSEVRPSPHGTRSPKVVASMNVIAGFYVVRQECKDVHIFVGKMLMLSIVLWLARKSKLASYPH